MRAWGLNLMRVVCAWGELLVIGSTGCRLVKKGQRSRKRCLCNLRDAGGGCSKGGASYQHDGDGHELSHTEPVDPPELE